MGYTRQHACIGGGGPPSVAGGVVILKARGAGAGPRLRGDYLAPALTRGRDTGGHPPRAEIESIAHKRLAYDEARLACEALQRAISRGYVDIGQGMAVA